MSTQTSNDAAIPAPPCVAVDGRDDANRWFSEEIQPHGGQLKAWLKGKFPGVRDVDDVVQESYLRIWKARAGQPIAYAKALLFTIAGRVAIDLVRREKASPLREVRDLAALPVSDGKESVVERLTRQEKLTLLSLAIVDLPARMREVFILHKIEGLTNPEVARRLGISEKAAENHSSRGIQRVRGFLRERGIEYF